MTFLRGFEANPNFKVDVESEDPYQFQARDWDLALRHRLKEVLHYAYFSMVHDVLAESRNQKKPF